MTKARQRRLVQAVALGLGIGLALTNIITGLLWTDGRVYWDAGVRLATGEALYPTDANPDTAFKYAPWFAWAWMPLTFLPEPIVAAIWTLAMLAAWAVPLRTFMALGWQGRAVAFLGAPPLLVAALGGNVHPVIVAALFLGLERRWGPLAIGVSASLKFAPILFVVVYAARGEWLRAGVAVAVAAALWLPTLAYGIDAYPAVAGGALSLSSLLPAVYVASVGLIAAWAWRRRSWPLASLLVLIAASARFIPYSLGYLLCSRPRSSDATAGRVIARPEVRGAA